jgi:methylated-DNA-[protein]-cysteine S-methyltransferase
MMNSSVEYYPQANNEGPKPLIKNPATRLPIKNIPEGCGYSFFPSPAGQLALIVSDRGVHAILWEKTLQDHGTLGWCSMLRRSDDHPVYRRTVKQLTEYFAGTRQNFDIPVVLNGTEFQNSVWNQLREIPYGQTLSYEEQALRLGGKEKVRAVGRANGMNPIPILIPCHRVIGKNGSLTGFGGGLDVKEYLLNLESGRSRAWRA